MKEIGKMLIVLTLICGICGFMLAGIKEATKELRSEQEFIYVKGPAVKSVLSGSENDLQKDTVKIKLTGKDAREVTVYVGKKGETPWAVAFEEKAGGFGGDISMMVGFNLADDNLTGIGVTLHKETPGLGSRIKEETFSSKFNGLSIEKDVKLKPDGGDVDAITGATISSRAVCDAVNKGVKTYKKIKDQVLAKVK